MDNPFKSPAVISFCPGILGIERGLKRAGVNPRVVAYVEIEAYIIANLVAGMEAGILDPAPIWTDAKTFDARPFRRRIHGIIGGYPCPGESLAGLREGHLYKGFIWPAIRRAISAARPLFCFFENVDDHLTGTYPIVQRSLRNLGYRTEAGVYSAEEVGATHERQRLFILAVADSYSYGSRAGTGEAIRTGSKNESEEQREEWHEILRQWMWDVVRDSGKELGDSGSKRLERLPCRQQSGIFVETKSFQRCELNGANSTSWPAGQGHYQHDWEEPRTVKPGMGSTINGYNFREDLLRALGNSVVEQTAELAFIDLMNKHVKNLK